MVGDGCLCAPRSSHPVGASQMGITVATVSKPAGGRLAGEENCAQLDGAIQTCTVKQNIAFAFRRINRRQFCSTSLYPSQVP